MRGTGRRRQPPGALPWALGPFFSDARAGHALLGSPQRMYAPSYVHEHGPLTRETGSVIRTFAPCELSKPAWIH
eukprot:2568757-Pyramimonas_sp.AAC.1